MFFILDKMKYRRQMNKLNNEIKDIDKHFSNQIKKARKEGNKEEDAIAIIQEGSFECLLIQHEKDILTTSYLTGLANKLIIPLPNKDSDNWKEHASHYRTLLTDKGIYDLRGRIRREQKERSEVFLRWIMALTGIGGVLIGLISTIKN